MMMNQKEEEEEERSIIRYLKYFPSSFQFDPIVEKEIEEFLKKKLKNAPLSMNLMKDVHIYDLKPWELTANFISNGVNKYYFFTPRDQKYAVGRGAKRGRKYAVGHGAKRVDRIGYWKSSGQVLIPIYESNGVEIGSKKELVFYDGQQPNGNKTPWIMHEYKAKDAESTTKGTTANVRAADTHSGIRSIPGGDIQLKDWVICKIYKKAEEEPAATTTPSATLTAAAENRLNIIENTATRVENTATREPNTSRELIAGTDISYDTFLLRQSNKCLGKVCKRAEEQPAATPPASPIEYKEEQNDDEVVFNIEELFSVPPDIDSNIGVLDP